MIDIKDIQADRDFYHKKLNQETHQRALLQQALEEIQAAPESAEDIAGAILKQLKKRQL